VRHPSRLGITSTLCAAAVACLTNVLSGALGIRASSSRDRCKHHFAIRRDTASAGNLGGRAVYITSTHTKRAPRSCLRSARSSLIEAHEINVLLPGTSASLGLALARFGQTTEGLALLDAALGRSRSLNISAGWAKWAAYQGEANLLLGHVSEARRCADAALQHAREHGERGHEVIALRLLGDVSSREGVPGSSEAAFLYEEAQARARDLDMRPHSALCHLGLGIWLKEQNRLENAHWHLTQAVGMLQQMDMRFWLPSAIDHLSRLAEPAT
jgi:hypothetical protein